MQPASQGLGSPELLPLGPALLPLPSSSSFSRWVEGPPAQLLLLGGGVGVGVEVEVVPVGNSDAARSKSV